MLAKVWNGVARSEKMKTFLHSGDLGDVIVAMPVLKYLGTGILVLKPETFTRVPMTWKHAQPLIPLLLKQKYVAGVEPWTGQHIDVDLNEFRKTCFSAIRKDHRAIRVSLPEWYSRTFNVPMQAWSVPWLTVPDAKSVAPVLLSNSGRYANARFPWAKVMEKYDGQWKQIGLIHEMFPGTSGTFHHTNDFLEVAQAIAGAKLIVSNQSPVYHIAEGLKKSCILSVWDTWPNCNYPDRQFLWRSTYADNGYVHLPNLEELP